MNKKNLFSAVLVFMGFIKVQAQQLMVGPVSGVNFSKFKIGYADPDLDAYFNKSFKIGFHFGATLDYQFGGRFGVEPSVLFSQKGNNLSFVRTNGNTANYESTQGINYIDVPVLFKYKFGSPENGIAVMAGPSLNFAFGGSYTETGTITSNNTTYKINESEKPVRIGTKINSNFKGTEMAFVIGVGTYFEIGENGKLIIEARYNVGGNNILNSRYQDQSVINSTVNPPKITGYNIINDTEIISSVRNRAIQLSVGYLFEL